MNISEASTYLYVHNTSTISLWGMCSKSWQVMFYFRVGSGWYSAFSTWDGDGYGVTYTVRTRLWCGIWPEVEAKTEKWQQYPAKIWYCPTGFSFYSKGHNILYSVKSASRNSHSRQNTSWQNKCYADFFWIFFYVFSLYRNRLIN